MHEIPPGFMLETVSGATYDITQPKYSVESFTELKFVLGTRIMGFTPYVHSGMLAYMEMAYF